MSRPLPILRVARSTTIALVIGLLAAIAADAEEPPSPIPWRSSGYEAAASEALASKRLLWIEFTGPWCLYCRRMERETFSRPEVAGALRDGFVPVKVHTDEREDLVVRFQIQSLPAVVVLDADQTHILLRHEGYLDTGSFLAAMQAVQPDPETAMNGIDPVALVRTGQPLAGRPELDLTYDGRRYLFHDAADRDAFLADPESYLPTGRGECPVGRVEGSKAVAGDPAFGVYYKGHLYLCASAEARKQFAASPDKYALADVAAGGLCPHCQELPSGKVPGHPQYSAVFRGLRYLFPDDEHRQAFRLSPDRYIR
jgi:YHS domain-containing protein/thioredoxin-related protein